MKRFNKILKTDSAVRNFHSTYVEIEKTYPSLEKQVTEAALKLQRDPDAKAEVEKFYSTTRNQLTKLEGVAKASIIFYKKHKDDGSSKLSQESLDQLTYVLKSTKEEISNINFTIEQAQDCLVFEGLAKGALPE